MVEAPEKIWAYHNGNSQTYLTVPNKFHSVEYTRSDLVAELAAENERLQKTASDWEDRFWRRDAQADRSEALSRTGAVKVGYANSTAPGNPFVTPAPEGQQEPVAWGDREDDMSAAILESHPVRSKRHDTYVKAMELVSNRHSKGALVMLVNHLLIQAETRPSEQAVTEAMVEAAWNDWQTGKQEYGPEAIRSALKAAMEDGR